MPKQPEGRSQLSFPVDLVVADVMRYAAKYDGVSLTDHLEKVVTDSAKEAFVALGGLDGLLAIVRTRHEEEVDELKSMFANWPS